MQPKRNNVVNKKNIADDLEKMRQRREDRKNKEDRKNQLANASQETNRIMDIEYEKMSRQKKLDLFLYEPQPVITFNTYITYNSLYNFNSISQEKTQKYL